MQISYTFRSNTRLSPAFKEVPGHPNYEVNAYSTIRRIRPAQGTWKNRRLSPTVNSNGYMTVRLTSKGKGKNEYLHRIVALTFIGPPPSAKHEVDHIDGNKANNRVSNLRWVTREENMKFAHANGQIHNKGSNHALAKLNEDQVSQIRESFKAGRQTPKQLAAHFKVSLATIYSIVSNKTWKHCVAA